MIKIIEKIDDFLQENFFGMDKAEQDLWLSVANLVFSLEYWDEEIHKVEICHQLFADNEGWGINR